MFICEPTSISTLSACSSSVQFSEQSPSSAPRGCDLSSKDGPRPHWQRCSTESVFAVGPCSRLELPRFEKEASRR